MNRRRDQLILSGVLIWVLGVMVAIGLKNREALPIMIQLWVMYAATGALTSGPIVFFGRRRARWEAWELMAFIVPYSIWALLTVIDDSGKTLANLGEFEAIALAIPVAAIGRVALGKRKPFWAYAGGVQASLCAVAIAVYSFVPPLPEV